MTGNAEAAAGRVKEKKRFLPIFAALQTRVPPIFPL
jgi:hypothetical protein